GRHLAQAIIGRLPESLSGRYGNLAQPGAELLHSRVQELRPQLPLPAQGRLRAGPGRVQAHHREGRPGPVPRGAWTRRTGHVSLCRRPGLLEPNSEKRYDALAPPAGASPAGPAALDPLSRVRLAPWIGWCLELSE